jgi:hypothetical protein
LLSSAFERFGISLKLAEEKRKIERQLKEMQNEEKLLRRRWREGQGDYPGTREEKRRGNWPYKINPAVDPRRPKL